MSTISTGQQATVSVDVGAAELRFETGKLAKQADGAVVVRSMMTLSVAFDHCVVDGMAAAAFVATVKSLLELIEPLR